MKKIYLSIVFFLVIGTTTFAQSRIYTPTLRAPADNAISQMPDVLLDWDAVTGQGESITYDIQLAQSIDFSDAITVSAITVSAVQMSLLKFDELYFWRVRASDGISTSDWSAPFTFKVIPTVNITSPNNQTTQNPDPLIKWTKITGISNYDIQVDTAYSWATMASGTTIQLNDVFEVDENNAWAVGNSGTILHRTEGIWNISESGTTQNLLDVYFVDSNNGWACGAEGTILFYDGSAWTSMTSGVTTPLNGLYFSSANNGYAVGNAGVALKYDGTVWSTVNVGFALDIYAIFGLDENNIWVAGKTGNFSYYNGTAWANGIISNRDVYGLFALSTTNVWAVAKAGRIYNYDGSTWTEVPSSSTRDLNDVYFTNENNGFVVGNNGTLLNYNGSIWQTLASGSAQNLFGIHLPNPESGYIVGNAGVIIAYQGDGFNSDYLKSYTVDASTLEFRFSNLLFGRNHYFRMRARHQESISDWSTARSFVVVSNPVLTSPVNNSVNIALDTLVKWAALTGVVRYTIQLSTDEAFTDPFTYESGVNEYRFALDFHHDYYWRVNARHAGGISDWSPVFKFTTANDVTLVTPADNATNVVRLPRYTWQLIRGTEKYLVQVAKNNTFDDAEQYISTTDFHQTIYLLDPETAYYWRVKAIKGLDSTNWSPTRSFVTIGETAINEVGTLNLSLYPNPNNGLFSINAGTSNSRFDIEVYNLVGKKVFAESLVFSDGSPALTYDLRHLEKGIYLIKLQDGFQIVTRKLIIK
ncbi:MAG: hypothetical protein CVT92_06840 [Bacteroidetes bacterium HGW-Bacteroidetes-1]|jgi:photosystem II stability/assembly factor-like uncharacterized protein|nr:MAG: hypothetical protein CVT92_06840 [Bacteroidetes bacterium HGW-Bacteroidetes-1]